MIIGHDDLLDELVEDVLNEAQVLHPPIDPFLVAARYGITIAYDGTQTTRGRHKQLAGKPVILVRPDERKERNCWVVAHELGEVWATEWFRRNGAIPNEVTPADREEFANRFASRLLLPSRWFFLDAELTGRHFCRLKTRYRTASYELIGWRMLDLPQPTVVTLCDQGRIVRRRSNRTPSSPALFPIEKEAWQHAHREADVARRTANGIVVQAWAIHEPHWKREILHTILPDEFSQEFDVGEEF
ncbi:MAG: ImmA/IrrE family metallo-endopeptidase [Planctomycetota bacterium]|nr:ImmA/IrrE family metallo-endopeptidase [Planctomycetota bacterium]MDA1214416.1 ImmA/IrrE family metallo-endopeptidase [Planctomycetota bacterium]